MDSFGPGPGTCRVCVVCVVCVVWCLRCVGAFRVSGVPGSRSPANPDDGSMEGAMERGTEQDGAQMERSCVSLAVHQWRQEDGGGGRPVVQAHHVLWPVHRTGPNGMYRHQTETERWQPGQGKGIAIALLPLRRARRPLRNAMSAEVEALLTSPGPAAGPTPRLRAAEICRVGVLLEFAAV